MLVLGHVPLKQSLGQEFTCNLLDNVREKIKQSKKGE